MAAGLIFLADVALRRIDFDLVLGPGQAADEDGDGEAVGSTFAADERR
jgi:hypothetical protein